jgi:membrane-associated protein
MSHLFDITNILTTYGYAGVFVVVLLESGIFFALPGDSLLFTAGILATGLGMNIGFLIALIFVAAFIGSIIGYFIGTQIERLHNYSFFRKILSQEHLDKTHEFFERHGVYAIILSRFVPVIRTFAPIVAGVAEMNYFKFIRYSFISSALWSTVVTLLGFFLGRIFPQIKDYLSYAIILIIFISILPGIWGYFEHKRKRTI